MLEIGRAGRPRRRARGSSCFLLLWWRRAELDGVLDGIVYAGMVGIGFAFTENILYLASAYNGTDGIGPGGVDGADRHVRASAASLSPFAHPLFTAFTGIGVGIAVGVAQPVGAHPRADRRVPRARWSPTRSGTPRPSSAPGNFVSST